MKLAVIGCGKMGLPIAAQAASCGIEVIGVDINEKIVNSINAGNCTINEPGVNELISESVKNGKLVATTDLIKAVGQVNAVIVIIPVLLTDNNLADLSIITEVTIGISKVIKPGTIVSYETTLPIGTTRNVFQPILEKSGLIVEKDFYLVYSPERVKSLKVMENLNKVPKIVGGAGPDSLLKGLEMYSMFLNSEIINVGTLEKAEMIKLAGMIYRDVNIALANDLARYCDEVGVNLVDIIPHVNTNGEAHLLTPGIGVGGHCVPVYPHFIIRHAENVGISASLAKTARYINETQEKFYIGNFLKLAFDLKVKNVLILGLSFRPGVKEDAYSPSYKVNDILKKNGLNVSIFDPLYSKTEIEARGFTYGNFYKSNFDSFILITAHKQFVNIKWDIANRNKLKLVLDGRNFWEPKKITQNGIKYMGIGAA